MTSLIVHSNHTHCVCPRECREYNNYRTPTNEAQQADDKKKKNKETFRSATQSPWHINAIIIIIYKLLLSNTSLYLFYQSLLCVLYRIIMNLSNNDNAFKNLVHLFTSFFFFVKLINTSYLQIIEIVSCSFSDGVKRLHNASPKYNIFLCFPIIMRVVWLSTRWSPRLNLPSFCVNSVLRDISLELNVENEKWKPDCQCWKWIELSGMNRID